MQWVLGHWAQGIGFLVLCTCNPGWLAACTVGLVFGVMSVQQSEYWLLCQVGSVIGPVGETMGVVVGHGDRGDIGSVVTMVASARQGPWSEGLQDRGLSGSVVLGLAVIGDDGPRWMVYTGGPLRVYRRDIQGGVVGPHSGGPVVREIAGLRLVRQWHAGPGCHWG